MKLFNIDFHISVIADLRSLLGELGHQVDSLSLSNHTWVFGRKKDRVPALDGMSAYSFGNRECNRFFQAEGERLSQYDGFIVTHTPCLAGLYESTGKPVICVVSTRYDTFCRTVKSRAWLEETLTRMHRTGQLLLLTNNAYDAWHVTKHLGIKPEIIPSYCGYTRAFWAIPKKPPFLHGRWDLGGLRRLPHPHTWQEVAEAACCVTVPYNASLMSMFERHTMGMPLAVPSPQWVFDHPASLSELRHQGKPDTTEIEAAMRLADWYSGELPGITFFHDEAYLRGLLRQGVPPVHGIAQRKERIMELWRQALGKLDSLRRAEPSSRK
jgi:hypothetical protein